MQKENDGLIKKWGMPLLGFLIIQGIWLVLWLPGCFRAPQELRCLDESNLSEGFLLAPGVYELRAYSNGEEGYVDLEMIAEQAPFHALLSNSVAISAEKEGYPFHVWLLGRLTVHMECRPSNDGICVESVSVSRTGLGNRLILTVSLVVFGVIDSLLWFRKKVLAGEQSAQTQVVALTLGGSILLSFFPFLTDYLLFGENTAYQITRIGVMAQALEQGAPTHGGDLFFLFPAILLLLGFPIGAAYRFFVFVILSATAVLAYHAVFRCTKEWETALMGAVLYLFFPWQLTTLYQRGALDESLGMAFWPLVIGGAYLLVKGENGKHRPWVFLAGLAGIFACHLNFQFSLEWRPAVIMVFVGSAMAFFRYVKKAKGFVPKAVFCAFFILFLLRAVYLLNRIGGEGTPIFLYELKNMGTVY